MYRSDDEAARSRIESLEGRLRRVTEQLGEQLARHERGERQRCTSTEHAEQMARLGQLTDELEAARDRVREDLDQAVRVPAEHAELEEQLSELRSELRDIEMLGRGDDAMLEEIESCRRDIARLEPSVTALELHVGRGRDYASAVGIGSPVWARARPPLREALRTIVPTGLAGGAVASAVSFVWLGGGASMLGLAALCGIAAGWLFDCLLTERRAEHALVDANEIHGRKWSDAQEVVFALPTGKLVVTFADQDIVFDERMPRFLAVVNAAESAASRYELDVVGTAPKQLEGGS